MQFSTILVAATALLTPALAEGIFSITGTATTGDSTSVTLQVQNGNIGDAPTCSGTDNQGALPVSGGIPCNDGYSLTYTWDNVNDGIAATYTNPQVTFTYNVPNNGVDGNGVYQFGFADYFKPKMAKKARTLRV